MPSPVLQCFFWPDRWKCFVVCLMLNCTRRAQVEKVVWGFFERWPDPSSLLAADPAEVRSLVKSLGFGDRRSIALRKFSEDFIVWDGIDARTLRGVGAYAARCDEMLFEGVAGHDPPNDHALRDLWVWMRTLPNVRTRGTKEDSPSDRIRLGRVLPHVRR